MKKVLKRLSVLLIVLSLLLPYNIFAQETETITLSIKDCSQRYDASTGGEHDVRYVNNVPYFSVAYNDYIIFDVTLPVSGRYEVSVLNGYGGAAAVKTAICLYNGENYEEALRCELIKSGSYSAFVPTVMGEIDLAKGLNKIKVFHVKSDTHIAGITLKRVGDVIEDITLMPEDMTGGTASRAGDLSYIHFDTVKKAEFTFDASAGEYAIRLLCADYLSSGVSVFVGEKEYCRFENEKTSSLSEYAANNIGTINLEDGENKITIFHSGVLNTFFRCNKIILEPLGKRRINTISDGEYMVSGKVVDVVNPGYYKINCNETDDELIYYADGEPLGSANGQNDCIIKFKSGEQILSARSKDGREYFDFHIEALPLLNEEKETEFLKRIEKAQNGNEVFCVLSEFKTILKTDFDSLMTNFGAREMICEMLSDMSFADLTDAVNEILSLCERENQKPHTELYKGDKRVNEITEGEYKIIIDTSYFNKDITVIAAVYSGNKLVSTDIARKNGVKAELSLKIADGETYKLFYFENLPDLKQKDEKSWVFKNIYVSNGVISGNGTYLSPYGTIKEALDEVESINDSMTGDIVICLDGGCYEITEPLVIDERYSGKNGHRVIFEGNGATVSGGKTVSGWETYTDKVIKAPFDADNIRNLYVNGIPAIRAKSEFLYRCEAFEGNVITTQKKDIPSFEKVNELELVFDLVWQNQRLRANDITVNGDVAAITVSETATNAASDLNHQIKPSAYDYFYIENALELLDSEGEFYYDKTAKVIYYYPYSDETIDDLTAVVPISDGIIHIDGAESIEFKNMTFCHGAWNYTSKEGFIGTQSSYMTNLETGEGAIIPGQITINNAKKIDFTECIFKNMGSSALNFENDVTDCEIKGSVFADISASAVTVGSHLHAQNTQNVCSGITIKNSVFKRTGIEYRSCPAIGVYYERDIGISNNIFDTMPYTAVSLGWGWGGYNPKGWGGFRVENNVFKNIIQVLDDGGGVYTMGRQKTVIKGNTFENFGHIKYSSAFHLDSGSSQITVYDNVVKNLERWLMVSQPAVSDNRIYSNFINTENTLLTTEEIKVYDNVLIGESIPVKAQEICKNAGLSEEYEYLDKKADLPYGRKTVIYSVPKRMKLEGIVYEAENYKNHSMYGVVFLSSSLGYNPTAWTEYEIEVPESGEYVLTAYASRIISSNTEGTMEIYKGKTKLTEIKVKETGETWEDYLTFNSGSFVLPAGNNTIKIKCADAAFHMDCFALSKIR